MEPAHVCLCLKWTPTSLKGKPACLLSLNPSSDSNQPKTFELEKQVKCSSNTHIWEQHAVAHWRAMNSTCQSALSSVLNWSSWILLSVSQCNSALMVVLWDKQFHKDISAVPEDCSCHFLYQQHLLTLLVLGTQCATTENNCFCFLVWCGQFKFHHQWQQSKTHCLLCDSVQNNYL
jgi:hypothetical protein